MIFNELQKENVCKGVFFRARVSGYINSRGAYVYTETMTPLKRISCTGCEECAWIDETLFEIVDDANFPEVIGGIEDRAVYTLDVTGISRDHETGLVDDYDLVFRKVKE